MERKRNLIVTQTAIAPKTESRIINDLKFELQVTKSYFYGTLLWVAALSIGILALFYEFTHYLM